MPIPDKPRRIGILGNQAFSVVNFRLPLMREITRRGHQVFAIAPEFDTETIGALSAEGIIPVPISLSRTGLNPLRDFGDVLALVQRLKSLRLDAILSFAIKPVIYGTLAAKWASIPHRYALIAGLGYAFADSDTESIRRWILRQTARLMYRTALAQAERVFMQNPDDLEDFVAMGIVPRERMLRINGTGVDIDQWSVLPTVQHQPTFLLVARLLKAKGVHDYVDAARIVRKKWPSARFILLGGLDSNPDAIGHSQIESWVSEGIVEWPGHVPVADWLGQASVFVLPSYYREGVPRSIQEAMASGRAIITADTPGCRETVIEGVNGFLVPARDPRAIALAMERFIVAPELVAKMGGHSRRLAVDRFDAKKINAIMIEAMEL